MKTLTVEKDLSWFPCREYSKDNGARIRELWDGKKSLTALNISELDIPAKDRFWTLIRMVDTHKGRVRVALKIAQKVLPTFEGKYPDDKRPRNCLDTVAKWLHDKATIKEVRDAYAAVYTAVYAADAAAYAVYAATYAAAYAVYAATYAADAAAYAAAAATYAADAAAYAAAAVADAADAADAAAYAADAAANQWKFNIKVVLDEIYGKGKRK
jgi:hypothetical protein